MTAINENLLSAYRFHRSRPSHISAKGALKMARLDIAMDRKRFASSPWTGERFPLACRDTKDRDNWHIQNDDDFRVTRAADHIRLDHDGWYTDPYQDVGKDGSGLCYGVVVNLTHGRFYPGYQFGGIDGGPTVDFSTAYDTPEDAARPADSMAQHAAEDELEYQTAWQAGSRFAELGERISAARKEALSIMREWKEQRRNVSDPAKVQALCAAIGQRVDDLVSEISSWKDKRAALKAGDNPKLSFYPDERLTAAFNEGAGI